jgi:hypothetical protein
LITGRLLAGICKLGSLGFARGPRVGLPPSGIKRDVRGTRLVGLKVVNDLLFADVIASGVVLNLIARFEIVSPALTG